MRLKHFLMIIFALIIVATLLQFDRALLIYSIRQIPMYVVIILAALQILTQLLLNVGWHQIALASGVNCGFCQLLYINSQGAIVESFTPGLKIGGEITRMTQIIKTTKCSRQKALAIITLQKLFSIGALVFCLVFVVGNFLGGAVLLFAYGIILCLLAFFGVLIFNPKGVKKFFDIIADDNRIYKGAKIKNYLHVVLSILEKMSFNKNIIIFICFLFLIIWLLYPFKMYILVSSFHIDVHIIYLSALTFFSYIVAMLPIFPGGLIGFEGTMFFFMQNMGLAIGTVAVITIFFRFITFWFVMIISLAYMVFWRIIVN